MSPAVVTDLFYNFHQLVRTVCAVSNMRVGILVFIRSFVSCNFMSVLEINSTHLNEFNSNLGVCSSFELELSKNRVVNSHTFASKL